MKPARRLTLLHLDGSPNRLPDRGVDLTSGDRPAGFVGMSARHLELARSRSAWSMNAAIVAPVSLVGSVAFPQVSWRA
jgi:hypothetical protein